MVVEEGADCASSSMSAAVLSISQESLVLRELLVTMSIGVANRYQLCFGSPHLMTVPNGIITVHGSVDPSLTTPTTILSSDVDQEVTIRGVGLQSADQVKGLYPVVSFVFLHNVVFHSVDAASKIQAIIDCILLPFPLISLLLMCVSHINTHSLTHTHSHTLSLSLSLLLCLFLSPLFFSSYPSIDPCVYLACSLFPSFVSSFLTSSLFLAFLILVRVRSVFL